MDGIGNLVGRKSRTDTFRRLDGEESPHTFVAMTIGDQAEAEQVVKASREPLADVLDRTPARFHAVVVQNWPSGPATFEEVKAFRGSSRGVAFTVWQLLRDHSADFGGPEGVGGYVTPDGRNYAMTPETGIDTALAWLSKNADRMAVLTSIMEDLSEEEEVGN